jgi:hypothetical protein
MDVTEIIVRMRSHSAAEQPPVGSSSGMEGRGQTSYRRKRAHSLFGVEATRDLPVLDLRPDLDVLDPTRNQTPAGDQQPTLHGVLLQPLRDGHVLGWGPNSNWTAAAWPRSPWARNG